MFQEITISNFLSYRDTVTFSFEATKDTTFESTQVVEVSPGTRLLRFALVYGSNASGKSNLLNAFEFLREFWHNIAKDKNEDTGVIPFLLDKDTPEMPSEFQIVFFVGDKKYRYSLSVDKRIVHFEKLDYYPGNQPKNLFTREYSNGQSVIKFNPSVQKVGDTVKNEITVKCLPNMSFFAARDMVNCSLTLIDEGKDWLEKHLMPSITPSTRMIDYAGKEMGKDNKLKEYMLRFVHTADFNISNIDTETRRINLPKDLCDHIKNDVHLTQEQKDELLSKPFYDKPETLFEHSVINSRGKETYQLPTELQSRGTQRTIGVETAIYKVMERQGLLPIDELETSLHPVLVELVLEKFLREKNQSQLIVTTHYDPLLNTLDDLMRKDSVWFTEKNEDGNSILYPLTDYKGLNRIRSYQKAYRNGRFGAIPNIMA